MIYLDNAATTPMSEEVFQAMLPWLKDGYGNPNANYELGRKAMRAIDRAREQVASFINAEPDQIIFTSGGSESNITVLEQIFVKGHFDDTFDIATTPLEHDSIFNALGSFYGKLNFQPTILPNNKGFIDANSMENCIDWMNMAEWPRLVSVMHTNNETGMTNDMDAVRDFCTQTGAFFHTDCVQAAGSEKIDVKALQCDYLSLSAHKFHGPKGVGALFFDNKRHVLPLIYGGKSQEFGLRGGTQNVPAIVGMGKACEIAQRDLEENSRKEKNSLLTLLSGIDGNLAHYGLRDVFHINSDIDRIVKTASVRFDRIDAETLVMMADTVGVCISAGSACHSLESRPSRVLKAVGLTDDQARNSIRLSVSALNTYDEMCDAAQKLARCVNLLYN